MVSNIFYELFTFVFGCIRITRFVVQYIYNNVYRCYVYENDVHGMGLNSCTILIGTWTTMALLASQQQSSKIRCTLPLLEMMKMLKRIITDQINNEHSLHEYTKNYHLACGRHDGIAVHVVATWNGQQ